MWIWYILAGLVGGVLGGMGMGGGTLLIPILTIILHMGQLNAQAINLVSFVPMAVVTLVIHFKNKLVSFKELMYIIPVALVTCVVGVYFSDKVPEKALKVCFGVFMIIIGSLFLIKQVLIWIIGLQDNHKIANVPKNKKNK